MIYLNNGTTSYPKAPGVVERVQESLAALPLSPGRGCLAGPDTLMECRTALASLIHAPDPIRIILTPGITFSLNLALQGLLGRFSGGHVISTVLEHNAVIRPLEYLKRTRDFEISYLSTLDALDPDVLRAAIRPETLLVAVTHCSNINGTVLDIEAIARICEHFNLPLVIDAAQSAGTFPLDVSRMSSKTLVAIPGHKGLLGPRGTGALYIGEGLDFDALPPLIYGGTGIQSELLTQPRLMPLYYEAGTSNVPGFAGLTAGVSFVLEKGLPAIARHKHALIQQLITKIQDVPGLILYLPYREDYSSGLLPFNFQGQDPNAVGTALAEQFGILVRTGLHCAPLLHQELGVPQGTVRVSAGYFTTEAEIQATADAIRSLAQVRC